MKLALAIPMIALVAELLCACRTVEPRTPQPLPALEPGQLRVHWARVELQEPPAGLPGQDDRWQSGWTYDERGLRARLKAAFPTTSRVILLGESSDWQLGPGLHATLGVEARSSEQVYMLEWNVEREGAGQALVARTELAPREELVYFSIPPRGNPAKTLLIFLALHGPALDTAPKKSSCCRETH